MSPPLLQVTAGTVNYEGPITVKATSTGADSTLAGIGRLVADAQGREAPVQRLADSVAGKFCWTIMAASAATFTFWAAAGEPLSCNQAIAWHPLTARIGLPGTCLQGMT